MKERQLAKDALFAVTQKGAHANEILAALLDKEAPRTQGFVRRIVYGVLDRTAELDRAIDAANRSGRKRLDPHVRTILRLSLYQMRYMDKTADHGIVNDAVRLTKKAAPRYAGFVNGMLRTLQKQATGADAAALPGWMHDRLTALYGDACMERLLESLLLPAHLCIRMNPLKTDEKKLTAAFSDRGMKLVPSEMTPGVFRVSKPRAVFSMPAFAAGHFTAQDEASARVVLHAGPQPGQDWLDLCAAPGGKSTQLAERMQDRGSVLAGDRTDKKVRRVREHVRRLGLRSVRTMVHDATRPIAPPAPQFDGVLVDAPCSGLGLLRRKPDIRLNRTEPDLEGLTAVQSAILDQAARCVRPGGTLVYSTCTLLPEENEEQVRSFLKRHGAFAPDGPDFEVRTDMVETEADGFYMARLRRDG